MQAGDAAQAGRQWTGADAAYAKVVDGATGTAYATYVAYQRARMLRAQGRQTAAITALQALLAEHPQDERADAAVVELAQAYGETGEYEAAATQWQTLITQYPRSALVPQAYLSWGTLLMDRQRWAEAAERFHALVRFFPDHPLAAQAVLLRAQSLQLAERPAEAERAVREHLERPLPPEAAIPLWIWLGQVAARASRWEEAQHCWQTIVDRWPQDPHTAQAVQELAQAARETGHPQEAEKLWRQVVDRFSGNPWAVQARLALAGIALQRQDIEAAHRWLAPVTEDAATSIEDRIATGDLWRRHGAWAEARAAYAPHSADPPEEAAHLWWLSGACAEEANDPEAATTAYHALDQQYPDTTWAAQGRLALGQVLERQEAWDAARALYQRMIAQFPEESRYARERLDAIGARR